MGIFRNKEFHRSFIGSIILSAAAVIASFIWNIKFGIFTLVLCILLLLLQFFTAYVRYKKISEMSDGIDRVLHGESNVFSIEAYEGELAVLSDEIVKLTTALKEQAEQNSADKAKLADFIADISHQIKTPLTSANLLIQRAVVEEDPEIRAELCARLSVIIKRLDGLVTALLKLSRLDAGAVIFKNESIDLNRLMQKVVDGLSVMLELREQRVTVCGEGFTDGDSMWLSEAMVNIIKNCSEHTESGGTIAVEITQNALYTQISVKDSGIGFSQKDLGRIFERFYKGTGEDKGGFGIGLSLAKTIIEAQKGIITAQNAPGGGALFCVKFYR